MEINNTFFKYNLPNALILRGSREEIEQIDETLENIIRSTDKNNQEISLFDVHGRYLSAYEGLDGRQMHYLLTANEDAVMFRYYCSETAHKYSANRNFAHKAKKSKKLDNYLNYIENEFKHSNEEPYWNYILKKYIAFTKK